MRVEVLESLPKLEDAGRPIVDDAAVDRALRSFSAAIGTDDSLFDGETRGVAIIQGSAAAGTLCAGDFVLKLRGNLVDNRTLYFSLAEKLASLLKEAGSAESLAVSLSLSTAGPAAEAKSAGFALMLRLQARGNSSQQAALRWGLGLAHVQQALLFTSRYLRQQLSQSAD